MQYIENDKKLHKNAVKYKVVVKRENMFQDGFRVFSKLPDLKAPFTVRIGETFINLNSSIS